MRNLLIVLILAIFCNVNLIKAQSLIVSGKAGLAYASGSVDSEIGFMGTVSVENKFNRFFSVGINGKFGGTEYTDDETTWLDNVLITERELSINNTVYAINVFPKISLVTSDEIILSFIPEVGYYWMQSQPVIYFTDKVSAEVVSKDYSSEITRDVSLGLHFEAQYYINNKLNLLASIGWNNYDIGNSLNKVELEGDWSSELTEHSFYLYFEIGFTYTLFGKNYLE